MLLSRFYYNLLLLFMYTIITIFDSLKHFEKPILEYKKRLWNKLKIIVLKPSKKDSQDLVKKEETNNLIEALKKENGYKILLDIGGKNMETEELVQLIEEKRQDFPKIVFVIGGVYGYEKELYNFIDFSFSLSLLTFPHALAFLTLLEQIYRVEAIMRGKKYHY